MGIIIGFGSTEEEVRKSVKDRIISGECLETVLKEYNDNADNFDKMPRGESPERYTRVWYYEKALHFHHINRNHPFSPDGWALLGIDETFIAPNEK